MKNKLRKIMVYLLVLTLVGADIAAIAEEIIHTLTLPKALQIIEEEAFYGDTSIEKVIVPDGTTEIHARAFAQSTLKEINLPGSLTFIDDTAFEGLTGLTVTAREGSWAYDWALSKGYISPSNLNIENIEVDCGEIAIRNGEVYWENISGHRQSSDVSGIEADGEWRLESRDEWIAIISGETDGGMQSTGVEFEENRTGASRTGAIDVICGSTIRTITVVQLPYLEARLLAPEVLARDGVWETYYDEELDEYVDAKGGNYPVLDFEDLETVWEAVDGVSTYDLWVEPYYAGEQCYSIQSDGSDTVSGTVPKCYMEPGSRELTYLYTCIYDEEHDYYYAGTRYAFYISGEGLNDYSICFNVDYDVDEIISAEIIGYYGEKTELVIPDTLLDYPVTRINYGAFSGNTRITSVVIPNSVKDISGEAFLDCTGLTSVTVPESVEWIDDDAFSGCTNLEHFNVVEGSYAYDWAVKHNFLPEIAATPDSTPEPSEITENGVVYYLNNGTATVTGYVGNDTTVEIPAQVRGYPVTEIGYNAFESCDSLIRISISEGVTDIGSYAFQGCSSLKSISIPNSLTWIGAYAFYGCSSLTGIGIPDGVIWIGRYAFYACSALTSIKIPEGVTSIESDVFNGCSSLTSISIPEGVTSIEQQAFYECSSLMYIDIPDSVLSLGWNVFFGCSSLTSITIPNGVTRIPNWAFASCEKLTSISIPDSVTSIGDSSFQYCFDLNTINIPNSVTQIGAQAFYMCSDLTSIIIPNSVTSIGRTAFGHCSSLLSIIIPDSITSIEDGIFEYCTSLVSIGIPSSVTCIGSSAFFKCSSLTEIIIPDSVTSIDSYAFYDCINLTDLRIPKVMTYIGDYAFYECNRLSGIRIPDGLTSIGAYTFKSCYNLTSICIPDSVTSIGDYAFAWCNNLMSIYIPDSVTGIGDHAIYTLNRQLTIYGEPGSRAESYAKENRIAFSTTDWDYGEDSKHISVSGRACMGDGTPLLNALIRLYDENSGSTSAQTLTDRNGYWSIRDVWCGRRYRVECAVSGFSFDSISFRAGTKDKTLSNFVAVASQSYIRADSIVLRGESAGGAQSLTLYSNDAWTAESDSDWISISSTSGMGNQTLTVTLAKNVGKFRAGSITFVCAGIRLPVYVLQKGILSAKLEDPVMTNPAENDVTLPFGSIEVTWEEVPYAAYYVISLRDLTTDELLIHHSRENITGTNSALLSSDYFHGGRDYRIALAAIPFGVDSSDALVSWRERTIHIEDEVLLESASIYGIIYNNEVIEVDGEERYLQTQMENAVVVVTGGTSASSFLAGIAVSSADGSWIVENLSIGENYSVYAFEAGSEMAELALNEDPMLLERLSDEKPMTEMKTEPGKNNAGGFQMNLTNQVSSVYNKYMDSMLVDIGFPQGLFAEFFQSKIDGYSASNKRWECVVATVDYSWKGDRTGPGGRHVSGSGYDQLLSRRYDGSESDGKVLYVNSNQFSAHISGYLMRPESAVYNVRLTGDDKVRLSIFQTGSTKIAGMGLLGAPAKAELKVDFTKSTLPAIAIDYYNDEGTAKVKLEWKRVDEPESAYRIIPGEYLFHSSNACRTVSIIDKRELDIQARMKVFDEKREQIAQDTIKNLILGVYSSSIESPFFNEEYIQETFGLAAIRAVKDSIYKSFAESAFKCLTGFALDPEGEPAVIKKQVMTAYRRYVKDLYGTISSKIEEKIQAIEENWVPEALNGMVDVTEFFGLVARTMPEEYEALVERVGPFMSNDAAYATLNNVLTNTDALADGVKSVKKSYSSVGKVISIAESSLISLDKYDENYYKSYFHLIYKENPTYAEQFGTLFSMSHISAGEEVWYNPGNSDSKKDYLNALEKADDANLMGISKHYKSGIDTEILLYKELLVNVMSYASKDILEFL